eukprot:2471535-Rhodomonas_salina.3
MARCVHAHPNPLPPTYMRAHAEHHKHTLCSVPTCAPAAPRENTRPLSHTPANTRHAGRRERSSAQQVSSRPEPETRHAECVRMAMRRAVLWTRPELRWA